MSALNQGIDRIPFLYLSLFISIRTPFFLIRTKILINKIIEPLKYIGNKKIQNGNIYDSRRDLAKCGPFDLTTGFIQGF